MTDRELMQQALEALETARLALITCHDWGDEGGMFYNEAKVFDALQRIDALGAKHE